MRFFLSFIIVLIIDQFSKYLVISNFIPGEGIIINSWLALTYVQNLGAAFGLMQGRTWFFVVSALVVMAGLIYYNVRYSLPPFLNYTLGFIAGGAVGNLIDRIFYHSVIDFISIGWWPVFNFADMAIVSGVILLLFYILRYEKKAG